MGDPFRPAHRGEPLYPRLNAEWFSGVNRAVNEVRSGNVERAQQQLASLDHRVLVDLVNKSGSDIDRPGGVLAIDTLNFDYADKPQQVFDRPLLAGITPTAESEFVIVTKPLANGQPGQGVKFGYVFCRLNYTDEDKVHDKAAPTTSVAYLTSGTSGVPIIWRELEDEDGEDTTGEQWALVLLGPTKHYQIIRGNTLSAVTPLNPAFQIDTITAFEEHAATPAAPLWVAAPPGGVTLSLGTAVWAVYRKGLLTFDPGSGDVVVDWLMLDFGGSSTTPPLRRFELTADKSLATATATARFMAFDNSLVGSPVTIHDPAQIFSGQTGFRGYALLRTDLGVVDPDRWEIIAMERYAEFIVVEKYDPTTYHFVATLSSEDDWWRIVPATVGNPITINDPAAILDSIPTGQKVIARLSNPDTTPPTYDAISTVTSAGGKRVRGTVIDPGSGFVTTAAASFQLTSLTEVFGGTPPAAPLTVQQTFPQGYVAGQLTEAIYSENTGLWHNLPLPRKVLCSLNEDTNGYMYVDAVGLAGAGLAVETGTGCAKSSGGNADKLRVVPPPVGGGGSGIAIVHAINSVEATIGTGGELEIKINVTPVTVYGSSGEPTDISDTVDIWNTASVATFTGASCVSDELVVTTTSTDVLTPPS